MIKKIILFLFLILITLNTRAEIISVQQTPFGTVELLSCTTSLRQHDPIYLAVAIQPAPDWQLDQPNFNIYTSDKSPATLLEPFEQPYSPETIYPITTLPIYGSKQPITYTIRGFWRACKQGHCITEPIRLSRTLGTDWPLMTPECTGIVFALSNTPLPMRDHKMRGRAIAQSDGTFITLDFKKHPKILQFYDSQKQPLTINATTKNKRVTFLLPTTDKEAVHFFVRTHLHYYEIELPVLPAGTPPMPVPISTLQILWVALLFFLTSAAPIFWARSTTSRPLFHSQTKQMMRLTLSVGTLLLILLFTRGTFDLTYFPLPKVWTLVVMVAGLFLVPASPLLVALFVFLTPKPYFDIFDSSSLVAQACLFMSCIFITWLAFGLQLVNEEKIFKLLQQKRTISPIWWSARLPWLALILYTFFYL